MVRDVFAVSQLTSPMNLTAKENIFHQILKWISVKKLHLIIWTIFIFYEAIVIGIFIGKFLPITNYLIFYSFNIITFYFHAHVVMTFAFRKQKGRWWRLPLFILLELVAYLLITVALDYFVIHYTSYDGPFNIEFTPSFIAGPVYRGSYFICFATCYYFLLNFLKERKKIENLEKQRLNNQIQLAKSENAFLKAQIQPHLLFNTLDFIYQNARESSPIAAETILSLSEMMRYSVDSNKDKEFVLLTEEINQVENLINLHQLRKNHGMYLRFWYDNEIGQVEIIPMVLITLVENMFKHGELLTADHPAEVSLKVEQRKLIIETANLTKEIKDSSGLQTGLENIKKRLSYAYGKDAKLKYGTGSDQYFRVTLTINIRKDNQL